jgi:hypothetical protein
MWVCHWGSLSIFSECVRRSACFSWNRPPAPAAPGREGLRARDLNTPRPTYPTCGCFTVSSLFPNSISEDMSSGPHMSWIDLIVFPGDAPATENIPELRAPANSSGRGLFKNARPTGIDSEVSEWQPFAQPSHFLRVQLSWFD